MNKLFTGNSRASVDAILAILSYNDGLEASWCEFSDYYMDDTRYAEYYNQREQGYVIILRNHLCKNRSSGLAQLNIAFFEHRNSDSVHILRWEQLTGNPPTIDDVCKHIPEYAENKYATTISFKYNQIVECAKWIHNELETWWMKNDD